jgi:hypothetical protein
LPLLFGCGAVLNVSEGGAPMIDPLTKVECELKAAEGFFELAKTAKSPFMQAYYRRVAERYLSSQGEFKSAKARNDVAGVARPAIRHPAIRT